MGYPRFQRARAFNLVHLTSGTVTLNSTTWTNVNTGLDITLDAQTGDVIEYGINALWGSEAVRGFLDVVTLVSSSPVNAFAYNGAETSSSEGAIGWIGPASVETGVTGSIMYQLGSGDISSGAVTLRLRGRTGTASNKTVVNSTTDPMQVWAKNLGPVDPH